MFDNQSEQISDLLNEISQMSNYIQKLKSRIYSLENENDSLRNELCNTRENRDYYWNLICHFDIQTANRQQIQQHQQQQQLPSNE